MKTLAKVLSLASLAAALAGAAAPWRVPRARVAAAFAAAGAGEAGIRVVVAGPVFLKLLPRPRLQATEISATAEGGTVSLDAPALKADLDIASLLGGRWRVTSATLVGPTLSVDIDGLAALPAPAPARSSAPPFQLRLRSGLVRARSAAGLGDLLATGIDATASWSAGGEHLVVSGAASWRGTTAQFAGTLQRPGDSFTPDGSAASVQVDSPLFSFAADGVVSGGAGEQFAGRIALSSPALPRLARALDAPPPAPTARRGQISGDLLARPRDLSLSNAVLRLDKARFEGTLAWRREAGRGLLAGTLATDLLDVDALLGDGLDGPRLGRIYGQPITASPLDLDVDLRVSATTATLGRLAVHEAAMAALIRGDRMELTLDEAQAYGGLVKARGVARLGPEGIDAHADLSSKRVDLALLTEALGGRRRVAGALTARAALDGRGDSLRAVVADLSGDGQIGVDDGRLAGLSLAQALRGLGRRVPVEADRRGTPTTFDHALWDVSVRDGVVRIPDGRLTAPGVAVSFGAETDLPDGRVDVQAVAAERGRDGAPVSGGRTMPFDMRGFLLGPLTLVGRGAGLPTVSLPLVDGAGLPQR